MINLETTSRTEKISKIKSAIIRGEDLAVVKQLIATDHSLLLERDEDGFTLLHTAMRFIDNSPHLQILKYLLSEINKLPDHIKIEAIQATCLSELYKGETALHIAAWKGDLEATELLLEAGLNSEITDGFGRVARAQWGSRFPEQLIKYDQCVEKYRRQRLLRSLIPLQNSLFSQQTYHECQLARAKLRPLSLVALVQIILEPINCQQQFFAFEEFSNRLTADRGLVVRDNDLYRLRQDLGDYQSLEKRGKLNPQTNFIFGLIYYYDFCSEGPHHPDKTTAFECFYAARELAFAKYYLGFCYQYGEGVKKSLLQAYMWYLEAAEQGLTIAQLQVALMLKDIKESGALHWLVQAVSQAYPDAQTELGHCYYHGVEVKQDIPTGIKWYEVAAFQGSTQAQFSLAQEYKTGARIGKNRNRAIRLYAQAAAKGYLQATQALVDYGKEISCLDDDILDFAYVLCYVRKNVDWRWKSVESVPSHIKGARDIIHKQVIGIRQELREKAYLRRYQREALYFCELAKGFYSKEDSDPGYFAWMRQQLAAHSGSEEPMENFSLLTLNVSFWDEFFHFTLQNQNAIDLENAQFKMLLADCAIIYLQNGKIESGFGYLNKIDPHYLSGEECCEMASHLYGIYTVWSEQVRKQKEEKISNGSENITERQREKLLQWIVQCLNTAATTDDQAFSFLQHIINDKIDYHFNTKAWHHSEYENWFKHLTTGTLAQQSSGLEVEAEEKASVPIWLVRSILDRRTLNDLDLATLIDIFIVTHDSEIESLAFDSMLSKVYFNRAMLRSAELTSLIAHLEKIENSPSLVVTSQVKVKIILGIVYERGIGDKTRDAKLAFTKFQEAYRLSEGDKYAAHMLGYCYEYGIGSTKQSEEAYDFYAEAAAQHLSIAQYNFGVGLESGLKHLPQDAKASSYYQEAAALGSGYALLKLGACFEEGLHGLEKNPYEALRCYLLAAQQKEPAAEFRVGLCLENGVGVNENLSRAMVWYQRAADHGLAEAQTRLGYCYYVGRGVTKDLQLAFALAAQAAAQGNASALNNLSCQYANGEGIERNMYLALQYGRQAIQAGNTFAFANVGCFCIAESEIPKNIPLAVRLFAHGAQHSHELGLQKLHELRLAAIQNNHSSDLFNITQALLYVYVTTGNHGMKIKARDELAVIRKLVCDNQNIWNHLPSADKANYQAIIYYSSLADLKALFKKARDPALMKWLQTKILSQSEETYGEEYPIVLPIASWLKNSISQVRTEKLNELEASPQFRAITSELEKEQKISLPTQRSFLEFFNPRAYFQSSHPSPNAASSSASTSSASAASMPSA